MAEVSIIEITSGGDHKGKLMRELSGERRRGNGIGGEFGQERGRDLINSLGDHLIWSHGWIRGSCLNKRSSWCELDG